MRLLAFAFTIVFVWTGPKPSFFVFCCSSSPFQKLPIVVIQKFCFSGNVTSRFSSVYNSEL